MKALDKHITGKIKQKINGLTAPEKHQLRIAKQSLDLTCVGCRILGGPNHREALNTIHNLTGAILGTPEGCTCYQ